jgi:hypothetical protein
MEGMAKSKRRRLTLRKRLTSREISYLLKINPVSILVELGPLVTFEVFMQWKEDRRIKKEAEQQKKKADEEKKNKNKGQLRTGRELFTYDPTLFVDD